MKLTIDDLKPPLLHVKIKFDYGRETTIDLQLMSIVKWNEIGALVVDPVVPKTLPGANGQKLPNFADVAYQQQKVEADTQRLLLRLAYAISEGGSLDLPGETLESKAKALGEVDMGIINTLTNQLADAVFRGSGEAVQQRADTFLGIRSYCTADMPTNGVEPELVESADR